MKRLVITAINFCCILLFFVSVCYGYIDFYTPFSSGKKEEALRLFHKSNEEIANQGITSNAILILTNYSTFIKFIDATKDYDFGIEFCTDCIDQQTGEELSKKCAVQFKNKNVLTTLCMRARAVFFLKKKKYELSISDYEKAIKLGADVAWNYHEYSLLLSTFPEKQFRNGEKALELAKKALELQRDHFALNAIAAAYAEIGNFQLAVEKQNESLSLLQSLPGVSIVDNAIMGATILPELNVLPFVKKKKDFEKLINIYNDRLKNYEAKKAWTLSVE